MRHVPFASFRTWACTEDPSLFVRIVREEDVVAEETVEEEAAVAAQEDPMLSCLSTTFLMTPPGKTSKITSVSALASNALRSLRDPMEGGRDLELSSFPIPRMLRRLSRN